MPPIRGLTQSEKQRLYVDADEDARARIQDKQVAGHKYVGARVLECPQNTVEERRLAKELAKIEYEKQRKEAQLTTERHMLRMDHKKFLDQDGYLMPGFRYHKNGDAKVFKVTVPREVVNSYSKQQQSKRSASAPSLPASRPVSSMSASRLLLNEQIEALKRELRRINNQECLATAKPRVGIKSNKAYIRAHTNDSPFNKPGSPSLSPRKRTEEEPPKIDVSAARFSRKSSKPNCVACECSFHKTDSMDVKKVPELKCKWRSPPKGCFLKSLMATPLSPSSADIKADNSRVGDSKTDNTKADTSKEDTRKVDTSRVDNIKVDTSKTDNKADSSKVDIKGESSSKASVPLEKKSRRIPISKTMSGPPSSPVCPSRQGAESPEPPALARSGSPISLAKKKKRKSSSAGPARALKRQEESRSGMDRKLRAPSKSSPSVNRLSARKSQNQIPLNKHIKSQMERDEERLRNKVQDFVDSLPDSKPAITSWRPSLKHIPAVGSQASRTMEPLSDDHAPPSHGTQPADSNNITWSRYHLSASGASHILSDIYLATDAEQATDAATKPGVAPSADEIAASSFADLINCRYLRIPPSVQKAWE